MLALGWLLVSAVAGQTPGALSIRPCAVAGLTGRIECGELEVAENREAGGRKISLNLLVLRANGSGAARPDPIVVLPGGPGQAASTSTSFYGSVFAELRQARDIVLGDFRGTGKSNGLYCDPHAPGQLVDLFSSDRIRACRDSLSRQADLSRYTTANIVEDLVAVLDALHVAGANLYASSYGTRVGFELIRTHPERVRTATFKGVTPPGFIASRDYSADAYAVVAAVMGAKDQGRLDRLLQNPPTGMSSRFLGEVVRNQLYAPASARQLSARLDAVDRGDYSGFAVAASPWSGALALGPFLSVSCGEDGHPVRPLPAGPPTARTLGDFREAEEVTACADWVPLTRSTAHREPVHSPLPILLISGDLDPVTPRRWGALALTTLPNAIHVLLRENGHPLGDRAVCVARMMGTLIERRSTASIRPECEASVERNHGAGGGNGN